LGNHFRHEWKTLEFAFCIQGAKYFDAASYLDKLLAIIFGDASAEFHDLPPACSWGLIGWPRH
jgi:hypothetical protein